jgi:phosphoglucosamine mutase
MKKHPADIGFAFDGDGDRVMTFLADGTLLDGDQMLAILAQSWQAEGKLTPEAVVSTVMANHSLKTTLQRCGIALTQTAVGDKYVVEALQSSGALLGGESSGHMILRPLTNTGDGVLTALELLRIHTQIEPLALAFNPCTQILHNVRVQNKRLLALPEWGSFYEEKIAPHVDQVTCLIRASGTENLIRIMLQGEDLDLMESLAADFAEKIKELDHVSDH